MRIRSVVGRLFNETGDCYGVAESENDDDLLLKVYLKKGEMGKNDQAAWKDSRQVYMDPRDKCLAN